MTVFTTGRLAVYERMMQDTGERNRGYRSPDLADNHRKDEENNASRHTAKAGESHARNKS